MRRQVRVSDIRLGDLLPLWEHLGEIVALLIHEGACSFLVKIGCELIDIGPHELTATLTVVRKGDPLFAVERQVDFLS